MQCKLRTGSFVEFLQFFATFLKPLSALSIAKYIRQVITHIKTTSNKEQFNGVDALLYKCWRLYRIKHNDRHMVNNW